MAVLNRFTGACWKRVPAGLLNEQLLLFTRALHKSAASEALEISTTGDEAMSGRVIATAELREKSEIKNLEEMPGPSTLSNLIEFFWRDGFGRIHEIQSWHRASVHSASASSATYAQNGTHCCVKAHPGLDPWSVWPLSCMRADWDAWKTTSPKKPRTTSLPCISCLVPSRPPCMLERFLNGFAPLFPNHGKSFVSPGMVCSDSPCGVAGLVMPLPDPEVQVAFTRHTQELSRRVSYNQNYGTVRAETQLALCHYSTSLNEENFSSPLEFQPDRWVRKDSSDRVDNFGSIPFGYGIRSCIGRRIAELEMHLALTRVGYFLTLSG
ncbi:hypothetical protein GOODEAATRI_007087 [Goodea atripinnis]|uniref:Cytochrome P450 n=1 Tax=Goodea atripinnis TaxID=208336 RepID=A0ABV0PC44_9TELE